MPAVRIEELIKNGSGTLALSLVDEKVEKLALQFCQEIRSKKRCDFSAEKEDWEVVNLETPRTKTRGKSGRNGFVNKPLTSLESVNFYVRNTGTKKKY